MITYILIGIIFMFLVEYSTQNKTIKKHLPKPLTFGFWERTIGILFWPVCLGIFLYNFFKTLLR